MQAFLAFVFLIIAPFALAQNQSDEKPWVFTNADLKPLPTSPPPPEEKPRDVPSAPKTTLVYSELRDSSGHGEGWWRNQIAILRSELAIAQEETDRLYLQKHRGLKLIDPQLDLKLQNLVKNQQRIQAEIDALPEKLRRAGGLPAWERTPSRGLPDTRPGPPTLKDPVFGDWVTFGWEPVRDAKFYFVEVQCLDCCGVFTACDTEFFDVSAPEARFIMNGDAFRWRVASLDASGFEGGWTDWKRFERPASEP